MTPFLDFFTENTSRVNKFNIKWQIARVNARDIKDVDDKIDHVMKFLDSNKNVHNYGRVHNWVKMTGVAYKGDDRKKFEDTLDSMEKNKEKYSSTDDNDGDLKKVSTEDLRKVHKDLSKRKYGFQYKTVPKAHTDFMNQLDNELKSRE